MFATQKTKLLACGARMEQCLLLIPPHVLTVLNGTHTSVVLTRQDVLFALVVKGHQETVLDVKELTQNGKVGVPGQHVPNHV